MVHALEKVHQLLKPDGLLIDIHPTGIPPFFEVVNDGRTTLAGRLQETDDFIEYFQADDALADVIQRGLFAVERKGQFTFRMHAGTMMEMVDHITTNWSDAVIDQEVIDRANELMAEPGQVKEVVLREKSHIARIRRKNAGFI